MHLSNLADSSSRVPVAACRRNKMDDSVMNPENVQSENTMVTPGTLT